MSNENMAFNVCTNSGLKTKYRMNVQQILRYGKPHWLLRSDRKTEFWLYIPDKNWICAFKCFTIIRKLHTKKNSKYKRFNFEEQIKIGGKI